MRRKVASWREHQPEREWFYTLECGHKYPAYDGGLNDEQKESIDRAGGVDCYECARLKQHVENLEKKAAEIRTRLQTAQSMLQSGEDK